MNEPRQLVKIAPTLRYFLITALAPMMQRMRDDARLPSAFILELGTTVVRTFAAANSGCMCLHVLCPQQYRAGFGNVRVHLLRECCLLMLMQIWRHSTWWRRCPSIFYTTWDSRRNSSRSVSRKQTCLGNSIAVRYSLLK